LVAWLFLDFREKKLALSAADSRSALEACTINDDATAAAAEFLARLRSHWSRASSFNWAQ